MLATDVQRSRRFPKRLALLLACVALALWAPLFVVMAAEGISPSTYSIKDGVLTIESHANTFAYVAFPYLFAEETKELEVEIGIRVSGSVGASWGPGIHLYWDTQEWIAIRNVGSRYRLEGFIEGRWMREDEWGVRPTSGRWSRLKLVWRQAYVDVYVSPDEELWHFLTQVPRPGQGVPIVIIGKGLSGSANTPGPYLANPSTTDLGAWGVVDIRRVQVRVDGKVLLNETFSDSLLNTERWIPVMYGDPDLAQHLERLRQFDAKRVEEQAGLRRDDGAATRGVASLFDLARWETWRGSVSRPATMYKAALLEIARRNFATSPAGAQALSELKNEVSLVMQYGPNEIAHMIPETTPTGTGMTPSPVSNVGFPHGDWRWSPHNPDVLIDGPTGMAFPNDQYPEDIVLVANYGGKEQRFTFHRSQDWRFNGIPLASSFTGRIRTEKVIFMAEQVEKIALLYALTQDPAYARQAKAILLRFAEVYPYYLVNTSYSEIADMDPLEAALNIGALPQDELVVPPNQPNRSLQGGLWSAGRLRPGGVEGISVLQLAVAYDLVADAVDENGNPIFTEEERYLVERDALLEGTKLLLANPSIDNKSISGRAAVAAVGATVGDPVLVRWGLEGLRAILDHWFLPDGSTSESPAYALQVLTPVLKLTEILEGYSDPPGYVDESGGRIDNLSLYDDPKYHAVWQNMYLSLLPDLRYPPIADSYTTSTLSNMMIMIMAMRFDNPEYKGLLRHRIGSLRDLLLYQSDSFDLRTAESPRFYDVLFPSWRLGFLRSGRDGKESTLILNMSDWGVHHHYDSLDLYYWKGGQELLSDLGYLWDHPRQMMTMRSVAHNLVVVDEANQRTAVRGGDVRLFHPLGRFKVMEGRSAAYAQTSTYQRFVAQIEHPGENSYVFDVFRVRGGNVHDFVYHGPGNRFELDGLKLQPSSVSLAPYEFVNVREGTAANWRIEWRVPGGRRFQTIAIDGGGERALIADGWGQRESKHPYTTLPFVIRRRTAAPGDRQGADSRFMAVYEGYSQTPMVKNVQMLSIESEAMEGAHETVGVMVEAKEYTDYIIHAYDVDRATARTPHGDLHFEGAVGVASFRQGELEVMGVINGSRIHVGRYGVEMVTSEYELAGEIVETFTDGFLVSGMHDALANLVGWEIFVQNGPRQTAYPIRDVQFIDGNTRVYTWNRQGGFPFDAGTKWNIPSTGYIQKERDGTFTLSATGPLVLHLPSEAVDPQQLGYHPGRVESGSRFDESAQWQPVPHERLPDGIVRLYLNPRDEGGGHLRLRLR